MAIAYVKEIANAIPANPGSTYGLSVASAPAANDLLILSVAWNDVTNTLSSVTDSKGNTWHVDVQVAGATTSESVAVASTSQGVGNLTTSDTITLHFSGSVTVSLAITCHEFSGAVNTVDQTASNTGSTGLSRSGGTTPATTNANDLVWAAFGVNGAETAFTPVSGYTSPATSFYANSTHSSVEFEYKIVSATGTQNPIATGGLSFKSVGVTVVYEAGGSSNSVTISAVAATATTSLGPMAMDIRVTPAPIGATALGVPPPAVVDDSLSGVPALATATTVLPSISITTPSVIITNLRPATATASCPPPVVTAVQTVEVDPTPATSSASGVAPTLLNNPTFGLVLSPEIIQALQLLPAGSYPLSLKIDD